ncbi:MAG TPA: hypothetical protein VK708_07320 [Bryobacteraceae bacterium]|nr:hypothetical protein [Bryobacteraceae bacterium]
MRLAKSIVLLFPIALITFVGLVGAKDTPDGFSGKWVLDKHSPRPGDAPNSLETKIKQDNSGVTIESSFKEPDNGVVPLLYLGVMTNKLHLSTDGQEQQSQIGPFMAAFKTTSDGNKLETDWKAQINGDPVEGHWVHTLSEDGKHMTLEIKETSTHGQHAEATLNFVRK